MNERTRIGLDVDGVLRGFVQRVIELAAQEGVTVPTPKAYEFLGQKIGDQTIAQKIWTSEDWLEEVFVNAPILEKSISGYNLFCDDPQFEVYIVSAQKKSTEYLTDKWLLKNGFDRHVRNIYTHKKLEAPCQILVDDKIENVDDYNNNARMGVIYTRPYNVDSVQPYRGSDLIEIYNLLK